MIKLILKFFITCSIIFAGTSQAGPITTDLTDDFYFSYKGIDYAWASSVNSQRVYMTSSFEPNILLDPKTHKGWDFATPEQLVMLTADFTGVELLEKFTRADQSFKHAFEYWNTFIDGVVSGIGTDNMLFKEIRSQWSWVIPNGEVFDDLSLTEKFTQHLEIQNTNFTDYETFYVRPTPVPEPSTLMIFSLGLITLVSKKKVFN
jgi:hypothetical protein